jgi:hypothetical protein
MRVITPRGGQQPSAGSVAERSAIQGGGSLPSVASALSALAAFMGEDDLFRDPFAEGMPSAR